MRSATAHVVTGNSFEPLIDGEEIFPRVLREVESARDSLLLMQLLNKPSFRPDPASARRVTLDRALLEAAQRGVRVRILLNQNGIAPDDAAATEQWFAKRATGLPIIVRKFPLRPGVMHAKLVISDGERALLVDPPFEPRWWDTHAHPLRSRVRGFGYPEHHVSAALRGPIVRELTRTFETLWDHRAQAASDGERHLGISDGESDERPGDVRMRVVRTSPAGIFQPAGESDILECYRAAFARARSWIYIENQYFTSRRARDLVRDALRRDPTLHVILVLNEAPDAWFYPRMQDARLRELGWPTNERLVVLSAWQMGPDDDGAPAVRPIYLHSKVALVDDRWATLGSANLDGVGLDRSSFLPDYRSIEMNVELDDARPDGPVASLRRRLWSEHLGEPPARLRDEPAEGWAAFWRARADEDLAALATDATSARGRVLPYHPALPRGTRRLGWFAPVRFRP